MTASSCQRWIASVTLLCVSWAALGQRAFDASKHSAGEATMKKGYVTLSDGVRLHFTRVGEGDRIIVIPNEVYMAEDFQSLGAAHTIIFYDLRSRGRSNGLTSAEQWRRGIHLEVDDLEAVRRHFGVERMSVLAHSYPAVIAALYAMKFPGHVDRVVQIGPPPADAQAEIPAQYRYADAVGGTAFVKLQQLQKENPAADPVDLCHKGWEILRPVYVSRQENASLLAHWGFCDLQNEREAMSHFTRNILPSLQALKITPTDYANASMPFLVIHGTHDRNAPYGGGREWARQLPNARLLTIDGAAHVPHIEARAPVLTAIRAFLGGQWPIEAMEMK